MITGAIGTAATHVRAAFSVSPGGTGCSTICPKVARWAVARSGGGIAVTAVLAYAVVLTVSPIKSTGAFQLTGVTIVAGGTDTFPSHRVAVLMLAGALADFSTVQAIGTWNTSLITAVAGEPRRTSALASHVIARCSWRAVAELRAVIPVGAGEAGFIAVLSPPAPVAVTNATNVVTGPAVVAVAFLLALDSEGSLWTGVLTRFSHPASQAHAGPRLSVADPSILTRAVLQAAVPVCPRSALLFTS